MKISKIPKVDVIKVAIPAAACPYKIVGTAFALECIYGGKDRAECDLSRCENLVAVDEKDLEHKGEKIKIMKKYEATMEFVFATVKFELWYNIEDGSFEC